MADLGSYDWAVATSGQLEAADRRAFLRPVLSQFVTYAVGRMRLVLGLRGKAGTDLDLEGLALPDSALASRAEEEARDTLSAATLGHSYRTYAFALVLAGLDGLSFDAEELFVGSLLHDICLEAPQPEGCFAVRGGLHSHDLALGAGADEAQARRIAEGIIHHITPGVGLERGPLPLLLQAGAMVDLTGYRLWDLAPGYVQAVVGRFPRRDVKVRVSRCWAAEARTFRPGRAAYLERMAWFSLLIRAAPYRG